MLRREIERLVNQDRNYFAAAMLSLGEADAMITGTTRPFSQSLRQVRTVIDDAAGVTPFGVNVIVGRNHTVLIADTAVTERPTAEQYAAIAMRSSAFARRMGLEPRVSFSSYTTFGNPPGVHRFRPRHARGPRRRRRPCPLPARGGARIELLLLFSVGWPTLPEPESRGNRHADQPPPTHRHRNRRNPRWNLRACEGADSDLGSGAWPLLSGAAPRRYRRRPDPDPRPGWHRP